MEDFTMSVFLTKEDLHKAKAEYFESHYKNLKFNTTSYPPIGVNLVVIDTSGEYHKVSRTSYVTNQSNLWECLDESGVTVNIEVDQWAYA